MATGTASIVIHSIIRGGVSKSSFNMLVKENSHSRSCDCPMTTHDSHIYREVILESEMIFDCAQMILTLQTYPLQIHTMCV